MIAQSMMPQILLRTLLSLGISSRCKHKPLHVSFRSELDRKRSEIRGSAAQGRLDQSRWPRKDPSKPVRFVARFLRAHLPESHSRGAPAPPAPRRPPAS